MSIARSSNKEATHETGSETRISRGVSFRLVLPTRRGTFQFLRERFRLVLSVLPIHLRYPVTLAHLEHDDTAADQEGDLPADLHGQIARRETGHRTYDELLYAGVPLQELSHGLQAAPDIFHLCGSLVI